jgi:outer membrane protein OmpA-like peptidoglycan-associated protein
MSKGVAMRHIRHAVAVLPTALLVVTGCATKDFVKRTVERERVEVNHRIDRVEGRMAEGSRRLRAVEARASEQAQRFEDVGARVGPLETSVEQAATTARNAYEDADTALGRADGAMSRTEEVDGRLTDLWNKRNVRTVVDTLDVRFAFGQAELSDAAQSALLGLVEHMKRNLLLAIELEGYTDDTGPNDYNVALSQRRVNAVSRFLVQQGIEQTRINGLGLGPVADRNRPADQKRRVAVKIIASAD